MKSVSNNSLFLTVITESWILCHDLLLALYTVSIFVRFEKACLGFIGGKCSRWLSYGGTRPVRYLEGTLILLPGGRLVGVDTNLFRLFENSDFS